MSQRYDNRVTTLLRRYYNLVTIYSCNLSIILLKVKARVSLLKHAAMICELEKILDRPVDIVEDGTLRPRVRESVNQDRKLIYERER